MSDAFPKRLLIVNADDFGLSEGVNRGIVRAHEHGIVTSASLMVRQPAAEKAAAYARGRPGLSVGLHLDLGEWVYRDGQWQPLYEVVPADDPAAVAEEVSRQFERFVELVGRPPTHVDSHQHAHRSEPLRSAAQALAERLSVPLRHFTPAVRYCGDFYGQGRRGEPLPDLITPQALAAILRALPPGVTELACHPGEVLDLQSVYRHERMAEVAALSDPLVRAVIAEQAIKLIPFTEFA
jgi:predicted glycoside hydrolase/deacetylase ChbG (UPF0249 family)